MATGNILNPSRSNRIPLGIKAERLHHVITHNPSSANPGEVLYVRIPRLSPDMVFVPGSIYLSADLNITGNNNNYVVENVGRNIISKIMVRFGGETIFQLENYNLFSTYKDLWLSKSERDNCIFQGIQPSNMKKLRSGANDAVKTDAEDNMLFKIYDKKYKIPLDHPLINDHGPLYKWPIQDDIIFEITLAEPKLLLISSAAATMNYSLSNICLEYDTVLDPTIASNLQQSYQSGYSVLYDWIDHVKTVSVASNDTLINENLNFPRRSIKGILLFFLSTYTSGARDSEKFENPNITKAQVTIEGLANKVFPQDMRMLDQWTEARKHFMPDYLKSTSDSNMTLENYYCKNMYAFWLDLRTTEDNRLHGSGVRLQNTKDGIQLSITKDTGKGPYNMHVFLVSDAQLNISNSQLNSLQY